MGELRVRYVDVLVKTSGMKRYWSHLVSCRIMNGSILEAQSTHNLTR